MAPLFFSPAFLAVRLWLPKREGKAMWEEMRTVKALEQLQLILLQQVKRGRRTDVPGLSKALRSVHLYTLLKRKEMEEIEAQYESNRLTDEDDWM